MPPNCVPASRRPPRISQAVLRLACKSGDREDKGHARANRPSSDRLTRSSGSMTYKPESTPVLCTRENNIAAGAGLPSSPQHRRQKSFSSGDATIFPSSLCHLTARGHHPSPSKSASGEGPSSLLAAGRSVYRIDAIMKIWRRPRSSPSRRSSSQAQDSVVLQSRRFNSGQAASRLLRRKNIALLILRPCSGRAGRAPPTVSAVWQRIRSRLPSKPSADARCRLRTGLHDRQTLPRGKASSLLLKRSLETVTAKAIFVSEILRRPHCRRRGLARAAGCETEIAPSRSGEPPRQHVGPPMNTGDRPR